MSDSYDELVRRINEKSAQRMKVLGSIASVRQQMMAPDASEQEIRNLRAVEEGRVAAAARLEGEINYLRTELLSAQLASQPTACTNCGSGQVDVRLQDFEDGSEQWLCTPCHEQQQRQQQQQQHQQQQQQQQQQRPPPLQRRQSVIRGVGAMTRDLQQRPSVCENCKSTPPQALVKLSNGTALYTCQPCSVEITEKLAKKARERKLRLQQEQEQQQHAPIKHSDSEFFANMLPDVNISKGSSIPELPPPLPWNDVLGMLSERSTPGNSMRDNHQMSYEVVRPIDEAARGQLLRQETETYSIGGKVLQRSAENSGAPMASSGAAFANRAPPARFLEASDGDDDYAPLPLQSSIASPFAVDDNNNGDEDYAPLPSESNIDTLHAPRRLPPNEHSPFAAQSQGGTFGRPRPRQQRSPPGGRAAATNRPLPTARPAPVPRPNSQQQHHHHQQQQQQQQQEMKPAPLYADDERNGFSPLAAGPQLHNNINSTRENSFDSGSSWAKPTARNPVRRDNRGRPDFGIDRIEDRNRSGRGIDRLEERNRARPNNNRNDDRDGFGGSIGRRMPTREPTKFQLEAPAQVYADPGGRVIVGGETIAVRVLLENSTGHYWGRIRSPNTGPLVFIPPAMLNGAQHRDIAMLRVKASRSNKGKLYGKVMRILDEQF